MKRRRPATFDVRARYGLAGVSRLEGRAVQLSPRSWVRRWLAPAKKMIPDGQRFKSLQLRVLLARVDRCRSDSEDS